MAQLLRGFEHEASLDGLAPARTMVRRIGAWIAERRLRAETMRELSLLHPRDLQDLAITPTDFQAIANGTWKR